MTRGVPEGAIPAEALHPARRRAFQRRVLAWYRRFRRDLPWRRTTDPYHILVSEVMLQQTPVARVIPKYREWLSRYPSLEALARASRREVREAWVPLGYNIRPLRLRDIARSVVRRYGGRLPRTRDELLALRGIGPYTAGAILSFAFGHDVPVLDTNIRRVLGRMFFPENALPRDRDLWRLAELLLPRGRAADFNQALMDIGATVCTARRPLCFSCPLAAGCESFPLDGAGRPSDGEGGQRPRAPGRRPGAAFSRSRPSPRVGRRRGDIQGGAPR